MAKPVLNKDSIKILISLVSEEREEMSTVGKDAYIEELIAERGIVKDFDKVTRQLSTVYDYIISSLEKNNILTEDEFRKIVTFSHAISAIEAERNMVPIEDMSVIYEVSLELKFQQVFRTQRQILPRKNRPNKEPDS